MKRSSLVKNVVLPLLMAAPVVVAAQNTTVTTERQKQINGPAIPAQVLERANVSTQPRYYLDTVDTLNRFVDDENRKAPGLTKNNYIARVFSIHNTEAIHIQSYLLRSLAYEGGVAEVMGMDGVTAPDGKAVQYLFVTAPDFMIPGIEEIVQMCDRPGFAFFDATGKDFGGGPGAVQYIGRHRTASELKNILAATELGNIGAFLFPPFADDSTNSIYVVDNPQDMADNLAALRLFDIPPVQVELEVAIYEISNGNLGKIGLDWDAWKRFTTGEFTYTSTDSQVFFSDRNDSFETLLSLDARVLAEFLNYTVQTGNSRVVTKTKVTMVNSEDIPGGLTGGNRGTSTGKPAVIQSTTTIPFVRVEADSGPRDSTNAWNEVVNETFEGVRVEILPFIGTESITLVIDAQVNSLVGFSKISDYPLISERSVNSVVNLMDGQPVVIGGLDKENNVTSTVGIPVLKDIPVVKYLFGKESTNKTTSQILVAVTPRIKKSDLPEAAMIP